MSVIRRLRRLRRRLAEQDGFTMIMALGVLTVTSLLTGAVFVAVQGDASVSRGDLDGKRAYAAAQAGIQAYLYNLNANSANSDWWQKCSNDIVTSPTRVSSATDETYTYHPVVSGCATAGAVGTVVDPTTGLLRMEFVGKAGQYGQQRTVVASFRPVTPLSYLWYTVHESMDPQADPACDRSDPSTDFYYSSQPPTGDCRIYWQTGDEVNGPMFSQDQLLVDGGDQPRFGRPGSQDVIASSAPTSSVCFPSACPAGVIRGREQAGAQTVPLPSRNVNLEADASAHGVKLTGGTTNLVIDGTNAIATTCTSNTQPCTVKTINLQAKKLIFAPNAPGGSGCTSYAPRNGVQYPVRSDGMSYGTCGDIYVSSKTGKYSQPLTIAADDDVIVKGDLRDATYDGGAPSGLATLGLVANRNVRVWHPCASADPDVTIDAAILTLQHSFFVDNYGCGSGYGTLTIHGSLAQEYRGAVGTDGQTGYLKQYDYDQRLALLLPPYLFDLQEASWQIVRETLCNPSAPAGDPHGCT